MATHVYIAGIDRGDKVLFEGISIEQVLTQAVDTCSFRIRDIQPHEGEEVRIEDDTVGLLFAGIIDNVRLVRDEEAVKIWEVKAQDYTYLLDRKLVVETYENMPADEIVRDIIAKYGGGVFTVNHVHHGAPVVELITFDYKRPSECFKELAEYVGWDWFVDYNKDIWFFNPLNINQPAPMALEAESDFRNLKHSIETTGLRNRVYVRGGTMLSDPWTYEIKADGSARAWVLPHKPHDLTVKVGGVAKTVGIEYVDDEATKDFLVNYQEKYVRCSAQTPTPAAGTTLSFTYRYEIDVITMVEDIASQQAIAKVQGGDGVYEHSIVDDSLTTIDAAEAAGMADLREHANPRVKGRFETEVPGWAPGQLVTINLPDRGIQGTFLVQKVTITPCTPEKWTYRIEYGGRLLGIADWLQALWKAQQKKKLNETALLHKFHYGAETAKVTDEVQGTLRTPPWKVEEGYEAHFDVVMPGDPTFSRSSVAYKSDGTQVAANVPRFEPGKFGKAVMVEEGTTNLLTNPSFEGTFVSGVAPNWATYTTGSATGSYAESADALAGSKAQRITRTGGATSDRWGIRQTISSAIGGTSATVSVYIKVLSFTSGAVVRLYVDFTGGPYGVGQNYTITSGDVGKWIRLKGTATVDSTDACNFYVWIEGANADILVDCAQVEAKPYATSFIDGTRAAETLTIPTAGVLNPQEGTVELVIIPQNNYSGIAQIHFEANAGTTNKSQVFIFNESGYWRCGLFDKDGTIRKIDVPYDGRQGVPTSIALTWKNCNSGQANAEVKLYKNGVLQGIVSGVQIDMESAFTVCSIGRRALSAAFWGNALYDDLRISSRARTDEEIAAAYQSGLPLQVDADTTYKLALDGSLTPQKQALSPRLQAVGSNLNILQVDNQPWAQLQYTTSPDGQTWGAWQDVDPAQNKLVTVTYPGYYKVKANRSAKVAVKNWKKPFDQTDAVCGFMMAAS